MTTKIIPRMLGAVVQANAMTRSMVEAHCAALESCAAAMEAAGIGVSPGNGHVHVLRRMSDSMRAEAASGKIPASWHDNLYAGADDKMIRARG